MKHVSLGEFQENLGFSKIDCAIGDGCVVTLWLEDDLAQDVNPRIQTAGQAWTCMASQPAEIKP